MKAYAVDEVAQRLPYPDGTLAVNLLTISPGNESVGLPTIWRKSADPVVVFKPVGNALKDLAAAQVVVGNSL